MDKPSTQIPKFPFLISRYPYNFALSQLVATSVAMTAYSYIDNQFIGMLISLVSCAGFWFIWYRDAVSNFLKRDELPQEDTEDY